MKKALFALFGLVLASSPLALAGQSNMDMNYGWGLTRGKEDIETSASRVAS